MYVGINRKKREEKEGERRESREEEWKRRGAGEIRRKVLGEESERRRGEGGFLVLPQPRRAQKPRKSRLHSPAEDRDKTGPRDAGLQWTTGQYL